MVQNEDMCGVTSPEDLRCITSNFEAVHVLTPYSVVKVDKAWYDSVCGIRHV